MQCVIKQLKCSKLDCLRKLVLCHSHVFTCITGMLRCEKTTVESYQLERELKRMQPLFTVCGEENVKVLILLRHSRLDAREM